MESKVGTMVRDFRAINLIRYPGHFPHTPKVPNLRYLSLRILNSTGQSASNSVSYIVPPSRRSVRVWDYDSSILKHRHRH